MPSEAGSRPEIRVIRRHHVVERVPLSVGARLSRALGVAGVYAIGYGNVGSSIYYALGIVAAYALGATPIALALAGIVFIFTAMTYAEGVAMVPTSGGSVALARRALNDLFSFIAGWSLALNYVVTTAISAVSAAFYLSHFWPPLKTHPEYAALTGIGVTLLLMLLNLRGVKETARVNILFAVIDLVTQLLLVLLGLSLILGGWRNFLEYPSMGRDYWPNASQLIFAVAMAMVAYVGLESAAQMAEETKVPSRTVPRALMWSVVTVIFMFAALPILALSSMPPMELVKDWGNDPVAGIASKLPTLSVSTAFVKGEVSLAGLMLPWVAVLAFTILLIASNAGILAGSRITYNMAKHKQLFAAFSRVHSRYRTPAFAVIVTSGAAVLVILAGMATPNLLLKLGDLYVFSAMLSFSMAHLSVWLLRVKEPDTPRPYKAWPTIRIRGKPISLSASLGLLTTVTIWVMIAAHPEHRFGPMIGIPWVALGIVFYVWFRRREGLDLKRPAVAEEVSPLVTTVPSPRRVQMARSIRHILIPVHRADAAEQITRIACDLSDLYQADITAVYVVNVPLRLPIDADLPEQTREAEQILEVASNIADTLYDKKIKTITLQARNVASAIVEYAIEDRADLILLSARHDRASTGEGIVFGPIADFVARRSPSWVWVVGYGAPAARTGPVSGQ